ncbi:CBS domain-containing protein [Lutibacter sp.]|uniref:CBS domain-containing protein n=1 Tax=Lutibacter sp. TaxID=1925666 RepID=UPI0025BBC707|nr:CBS domain-containing protein [Lutibacter sp.]MCF6181413.1 CBS domain-containing protein [Lutibacter sp.]
MKATPNILTEFKAFTLQTKIAEVKSFFKENTYSHFPIVNNEKLVGLISETDIQGIYEDENTLTEYKDLFKFFFIEEHTNFLEILNAFAINETNLAPVITKEQIYIGYYDLIDILHIYNNSPFLSNEGTIIILEKEIRDYSFSEICQIVESNNGKVLGIFISKTTPSTVTITLKFNASEVNEIIQSFRRFDYHVLSKHKEDFLLEELKERTDYLQKYLNI